MSTPTKVWKRHRTADEVIAQAKAQGIDLELGPFERGSDHIGLRTPAIHVLFNVFSGRFLGSLPAIPGKQSEIHFNSDNDRADDWYQTMVNFFYTDDEAPK
jgi:hypothetical protein